MGAVTPEALAACNDAIRAAWEDPLLRAVERKRNSCRHGDADRRDDGCCRICNREKQRRWYWRHK